MAIHFLFAIYFFSFCTQFDTSPVTKTSETYRRTEELYVCMKIDEWPVSIVSVSGSTSTDRSII